MKYFTLYRRDFKDDADDGESMFNSVLLDMGFKGELESVDTCEVSVNGDIRFYDDDGDQI